MTIIDTIEMIERNEILLPAMQRKWVWNEDQIVKLFDSILKEYPIGSILFWNIKGRKNIKEYKYYRVLRKYSERENTNNISAGPIGNEEIMVIMDGQQRLTSLFLGIKGCIEVKKKGSHKSKSANWKIKHLYFRPYIQDEDDDENNCTFEFKFMEDASVDELNTDYDDKYKYYKVADFYNMSKSELREMLHVGQIRNKQEDWKYRLEKLRSKLNEDKNVINYSAISETDIKDVLEIFTRINNGGTKLKPAELLFSNVITDWPDGREKIDTLIAQLSDTQVKAPLVIKEDYLIRVCMYLLNQPTDVKLSSFKSSVILDIKNNWENIKSAIFKTQTFLEKHFFADDVIVSYNALMPIIYYYYFAGNMSKQVEDEFYKYLIITQLFGQFSGNSGSTLNEVRKKMWSTDTFKGFNKNFQLKNLYSIDLSATRNAAFKITKPQIEKLIDNTGYGDKKSYVLLSSICDYQPHDFDMDHVCSKDEFNKFTRYKKGDSKNLMNKMKNGLPNLELLTVRENRVDKKASTLYHWVVELNNPVAFDPFKEKTNKDCYKMESFEVFEDFYAKRRELIINALCEKLSIS